MPRCREPAPNSFCSVEEASGSCRDQLSHFQSRNRFERDREYWLQQLTDLPEAATLSHSRRRHSLSGNLRRSTGYLPPETARQLADLGKDSVGISLPQVLISLIAAYYQQALPVSLTW